MPTIAFASSKGGAGKTTASIILASELARRNVDFTIIDADPNQHLADWGKGLGLSDVISSSESEILADIENAEQKTAFVIIDLEGTANITMSYAISCADLVIIPCKPSDLDGKEAMKIAQFINQQSKVLKKNIAFALLRTQTSALGESKIEKAIVEDFQKYGSIVLNTRLVEREAFRSIVSLGCYIHDLPVENKKQEDAKSRAVLAADEFALELVDCLKDSAKEVQYA